MGTCLLACKEVGEGGGPFLSPPQSTPRGEARQGRPEVNLGSLSTAVTPGVCKRPGLLTYLQRPPCTRPSSRSSSSLTCRRPSPGPVPAPPRLRRGDQHPPPNSTHTLQRPDPSTRQRLSAVLRGEDVRPRRRPRGNPARTAMALGSLPRSLSRSLSAASGLHTRSRLESAVECPKAASRGRGQ